MPLFTNENHVSFIRHEFLISRIYHDIFFSQIGLIHISLVDCSEELHALESGSPDLLAIFDSLDLVSTKIHFKVFENMSEMTGIWHVLHPFSAKVRKSWQIEVFHLVKNAIYHHIRKVY